MGAIGVFEFGDERHEVQLNVVGGAARVRVRGARAKTWANQFQGSTAPYIEQLTQKTGAFRSFGAFCQLLAQAIQGTNDDVSLELLTPADLATLRANKGQQVQQRQQLGNRRYLLVVINDPTFNTRVHYPLSLPEEEPQMSMPAPPQAAGVPSKQLTEHAGDATATTEIHSIVRQLQGELRRLQAPSSETSTFREKYDEMVRLNKQLKEELDEAQKTINNTKTIKLNKQMKKMVDHMEKALAEEKSRSKRIIQDQKSKIRLLEASLTETRTEAKHLEIRNRALTNELATYKRSTRGRVSRDSSRESRISRPRTEQRGRPIRSVSRETSRDRKKPPAYARPTSASSSRLRVPSRSRDPSPAGSVRSVASSVGSAASSVRSCSSRVSRASSARFDPTAYVRAKKAKEAEAKKRRLRNGPPPRKPINQSASSKHSRHTTKSSVRSSLGKNRSSTPDPLLLTSEEEDFDLHNKYGLRPSGDTKLHEDSLIREGSFNINEIDARLSALQQYMDDLVAT